MDSALFWEEGQEVDPDNPDMAALLALQEELTPAERAEAFKARDASVWWERRGCPAARESGAERRRRASDVAAARGVAARAQERGNEAVKRPGAFYARQAVAFYTQALEQRSGDSAANAVYHSNRAHAHLLLRNWGHALANARAALALSAGHVKARTLRGAPWPNHADASVAVSSGVLSGRQGRGGAGQARGGGGAVHAGPPACVAAVDVARTAQR